MALYRPAVLSWQLTPLVPAALLLATGIFATTFSPVWLTVALIALSVALAFLSDKRYAAWTLALAVGLMVGPRAVVNVPAGLYSTYDKVYKGTVAEAIEGDNADSYIVDLERPQCRVKLSVLNAPGRLLPPGSAIEFKAAFESGAPRYLLPFERDYAGMLRDRGIAGCTLVEADSIKLTGNPGGVLNFARRVRTRIVDLILTSPFDSSTSAFLAATLIGDDNYVDYSTRDYFSKAGIAHILALSGTHVAIIVLILTAIFFPLHAWGKINAARVLIIVALWVYALLTGFSPSVTRAVVMATVYLVACMMERNSAPLNSVAVAVIIILLADPASLYSISFQLSFAAVVAIIICGERVRGNYVTGFIVVTLAATVATAPLVAYRFHVMPTMFLFSNIVALTMLPTFLIIGIVVTLLWSIHLTMPWLTTAGDVMHSVLVRFSQMLVDSPFAFVSQLYPSVESVIACYVAIVLMLIAIGVGKYRLVFSLASLAMFVSVPFVDKLTSPELPVNEWMIVSTSSGNAVVVLDDQQALMFTDAPVGTAINVRLRLERRLEDYLGRHKVDSLTMVDTRQLARISPSFMFFNDSVKESARGAAPIDYLIIGPPFNSDLSEVIKRLKPRHIVLGANLHHRVSKKLKATDTTSIDLKLCPILSDK